MRKIKKFIMFLLILPVLFSLSSCLYEKPKTFTNKGITITLDNTFFRYKEQEKDSCILFYSSSKNINIYFYMFPNTTLKNMLEEIESQVELHPLKEDTSIVAKTNPNFSYQYYEFYYSKEKRDVYTLITGFSNDIYCEIAMIYSEDNKTIYMTTIFEWLSSIYFE